MKLVEHNLNMMSCQGLRVEADDTSKMLLFRQDASQPSLCARSYYIGLYLTTLEMTLSAELYNDGAAYPAANFAVLYD
jgi:hypothetical protein